jgi:TNF receptor-associated factor 4
VIDLKHHLNDKSAKPCQYLLVQCPLQCGDLHQLKDLDEHIAKECMHREIPCKHCGVVSALYLMNHHYSECESFPVLCQNGCGKEVERKYLKEHESKECINRSTVCLFHDFGCEVVVRREDYDAHIEKCKEKYMAKAHEKVILDMQSLQSEFTKIKEENQLLHFEIASLRTGLEACNEKSDSLKQEGLQLKSALSNEMSYLHAMATTPCELVAVNCIKTHLCGSANLVPGGEAVTFRITDYSSLKARDEVWCSPSFYITHGYKFCLAVHLNGAGAGKGTHVALYLHQVCGQFDTDLTWPVLLEEDLEICLMRQESPKESKRSLFRSAMNSPPSLSKSFGAGDASPTFTLRSSTMTIDLMHNERKNVSEHQILSVSQVLNQPDEATCSFAIARLELFCLQRTFEAAVFLNSVVIQCKLMDNQGNTIQISDVNK